MTKVIACVLVCSLAGTAAADKATRKERARADALFRKGKKLMGEKRYADACFAFEQSFKIDPEIGAELNVARCYQEWGKLARALTYYRKAEDLAKEAHDDRVAKIHEVVEHVDAEVPRLTIKVPRGADASGAHVTLDGASVTASELGAPQPVDPGPHLIEYRGAHGKASKIVPVERGSSSEITLDLPGGKAAPEEVKPEEAKASEPPARLERHAAAPAGPQPGRTQRLIGLATGGAGIIAVGVSSALALSARSKYDKALKDHCASMTNMCDPTGLSATHAARHEANIATVVFSVGAAAVAGGIVLYVLAPHAPRTVAEHALYLVPEVGPDGAGLAFGGRL